MSGNVNSSTGDAVMVVWPDGSRLSVYRRGVSIDIRFFPVDDATFDDIHGEFADSWRGTDDTGLYDYDEGETTGTTPKSLSMYVL